MPDKKVVKRNFELRTDEVLQGMQLVQPGPARSEPAAGSQPANAKPRRAPRPEELSVIVKLIDYFKSVE